MDAQLRRGILEVCVLKALSEGESYGYQIIKDISPFIAMSESTLYPILKRLEGAGALTVTSREHNGRLRKYYAITSVGRRRITAFLTEWEDVTRAYDYIRSASHTVSGGGTSHE